MKGYKATDKYMKCRGFQFELGVWYEHKGELKLCDSGFHFCQYPSGPWCYYGDPDTRIFEVEAEDVLETPIEPGADYKQVCRWIKLVREITPSKEGNRNTGDRNTGDWNTGNSNTGNSNTGNSNTGDRNTGDRNTGNRNTGDRNTGYRNTGDRNTGNSNAGDRNTGNWNTGDSNTGDRNTGNWNTGYRNTGDRNTGNSNTGDRNTGNSNTGNSNTGNWNAISYSSGFFCAREPKVISFDVQTKLTHDQFLNKYPESIKLGEKLLADDPIPLDPYKRIPGITQKKLSALHERFMKARGKKESKP